MKFDKKKIVFVKYDLHDPNIIEDQKDQINNNIKKKKKQELSIWYGTTNNE